MTTDDVSAEPRALAAVLPALQCLVCTSGFELVERRLRCVNGHSFDVARQGYVNLTAGSQPGTADTAAMVLARTAFLGRGHYRPLADLVAATATRHDDASGHGIVVDLAGGTGYYLATVLDALPGRAGLCVDLSAPALRRAATAHPRAAAVGADVWQRLPLADDSASTVVNVFGPRNAAEIERVLTPGGALVTASPAPLHLHELIGPLGMLRVDPDKERRHAATFGRFDVVDSRTLTYRMSLDRSDVAAVVGMGPTASHTTTEALASAIGQLPEPYDVTVAVDVRTYSVG